MSSPMTGFSQVAKPCPAVPVSRYRAVIGRSASTVSSSPLSRSRSTRGAASSGSSSGRPGRSRSSRPSSTRAIVSAAVSGLVIDAPRKIESRRIGAPLVPCTPRASTRTSPPRATSATSPGTSLESTYGLRVSARSTMDRPYARWLLRWLRCERHSCRHGGRTGRDRCGRVPPFGLFAAPMIAMVRDVDETPYCTQSSDAELSRVLTEGRDHATVLASMPDL